MPRRLAILLLALMPLLEGCASAGAFEYARDVVSVTPVRKASTKGEVTVVYRFGTPEFVNASCQWRPGERVVHGCAVLDEAGARCVVFAVEPRDFQDVDRLAVLGHEMWHCFGAKHA